VTTVSQRYTSDMATTIKVSTETRDRVKALADDEHRTADQVINRALDLMERERRRQRMREESLALLNDPVHRAEIAAIQRETEDMRAW
jgi:predicted transcriptional regulator